VIRRAARAAQSRLARRGIYVLKRHYFLPIPDERDLGERFWSTESALVGLDLDVDAASSWVRGLRGRFDEFRTAFPMHASDSGSGSFHLINGSFMAVDAHIYYALIRELKPRTIVEIGAGRSTAVALEAARRNRHDGASSRIVAVDPHPDDWLRSSTEIELIPKKVQDVSLDLFISLNADDILFIDSSHILRWGGDVQHEYLEILPRLAKGVLVHAHDIHLPGNYPRVYHDSHLWWNEQYLLQAFLAFTTKFEVVWPAAYMGRRASALLDELFPELREMRAAYPASEPSSFWMRVIS